MATSYEWARMLIRNVGGDPTNESMVRAVSVWMRFEGGTVNNPLFQTWPAGNCGSRTVQTSAGARTFPVYCTAEDSAAAAAKLLTADFAVQRNYGYDRIVSAIKAGDPMGFFNAVWNSRWEETGYGGPGSKARANMLAAYNSGLPYDVQLRGGDTSGGRSVGGSFDPTKYTLYDILVARYGPYGDTYKPTDILTAQWVENIRRALYGDGTVFNEGTAGLTTAEKDAFMALITPLIGKPIGSIEVPEKIAKIFGVKAPGGLIGVGPTDPKTGQSEIAKPFLEVGEFLGTVGAFAFDTENLRYLIALVIGVPLTWHAFNRLNAT